MIQQVKAGDKLTVIKVNSMAMTSISEITVDSIQDNRIIFAQKRKKYYLNEDTDMLVLKGHNLGITRGTWNDGNSCVLMSGNCNIGGLDRERMITLLQTNINPKFNEWQRIYWFDGVSEEGDPLFIPRPATNHYLRYREEAEKNNTKTAQQINEGDFIYSYRKGSKFQHLTDMLKYHLMPDTHVTESLELGKIVDVIEMSEEAFDALEYNDSNDLLKDKGGNYSDDVEEGRDVYNLSDFERETFYTHFTIIRTPSGRAITVDAQGYDYMRYTGLLYHYKTSMAVDCAKAAELLRIEKEAANAQLQAELIEEAKEEAAEKIRVEKEYDFLTVVGDCYDQKIVANNLRTLLKVKFPAIKFSVRKHYYNSYIVEWNDGPPESAVREITGLFKDEGFDGMTDSTFSITSPFIERYGGIGHISTDRNISDAILMRELDLLNKELDKRYQKEDYVVERGDTAIRVAYQIAHKKDYTPAPEPKPTVKIESKPAVKSIQADGVEIIDYSEKAFAVVGDTKPIKDTLKQLGGSFNGRLTCGAGWIFSKTKMETVKQTLSIA